MISRGICQLSRLNACWSERFCSRVCISISNRNAFVNFLPVLLASFEYHQLIDVAMERLRVVYRGCHTLLPPSREKGACLFVKEIKQEQIAKPSTREVTD